MYVSEVKTEPPKEFITPLQEKVYAALSELNIPFTRVDNDPTITMEDCVEIDARLGMQTSKTLLLCNRQKTAFYLFVIAGDKHFSTKDFSKALGVPRVSFATEEQLLDLVGTKIGASTVMGALKDTENKIRIVFDAEVLKEEWFGCTDTTRTCYMRLKVDDVINKYLPYTKHDITVITV